MESKKQEKIDKYNEIEKVMIKFKCELFRTPKTFLKMIYNIIFNEDFKKLE